MGKIPNPSAKQIDLNFELKVNLMNPTLQYETPLYLTPCNTFINMLDFVLASKTELNSQSTMFQIGAKVGDTNKYINTLPYTLNNGGTFKTGDWFVINMNP
jgi:hypothetical protein